MTRKPDAGHPGAPLAMRPDALLPLAEAAAAQVPDAAADLIARVTPFVFKIVRRVLGPEHPDVDDVAQDTVMALLSSLPSFRGDSTVLHYAGRVALFTALAARRRERGRVQKEEARPTDASHEAASASPLAELVAVRRREVLRGLLDDLPARTSEALALHFMLGYTVEEIARRAEVPANTVWSRLRLGKQALVQRCARDRGVRELLRGAP